MTGHAGGGRCVACGEALWGRVAFCPFCGAPQAAAARPAPVEPPAVAPAPAGDAPPVRTVPPRDAVGPPPAPAPPAPPVPPFRPGTPEAEPGPFRMAAMLGRVWRPKREAARSPDAGPAGSAGSGSSAPPAPPVAPAVPGLTRAGRFATAWRVVPEAPRRDRRRRGALRQLLVLALLGWVLWRLFGELPAPGFGTVTVVLPRGMAGSVLVDGAARGRAGEPIRLPAGRHVVELVAAGWEARPREVAVERDRAVRVLIEPRALPVAVAVSAVPAAAALTVDGRAAGGTPTTLELSPGWHRLRVAAERYAPESRSVRVRPGESQRVAFALREAEPRRVSLLAPVGDWSEPVTLRSGDRLAMGFDGWLRLRLDGRVILVDPAAGADLGEIGPGTLQVQAAGNVPVAVTVAVRHGDAG